MATSRTRSEVVNASYVDPRPGYSGGTFRRKRFTITYQSNRENGQIVKRESPLTMYLEEYIRLAGNSNPGDVVNLSAAYAGQTWLPLQSQVYARAYGEFKRKAELPSSEILLNVVERRKSLEMIAARAFQLRNLVNSLRKGRLGDAWRYMSLNPDSSLLDMKNRRRRDSRFVSGKARQDAEDRARNWRQLVKDVGSVILEVRYGWTPLMQDIRGAMEVLSQPIPDTFIRTSKGQGYSSTFVNQGRGFLAHINERVTIRGQIRVSNPNLDLANRLGMVNPASIVWETIPFSFLVDWFLPVGDFLKSFTDFLGLELIDGSITSRRTTYAEVPGFVFKGQSWVVLDRVASFRATAYKRQTVSSLPRPPLFSGSGLSPGRALNAVALLLQSLNPRKGAQSRASL